MGNNKELQTSLNTSTKTGIFASTVPPPPKDFEISFFYGGKNSSTLNIPNEQMPKVIDLFNEFLLSNGINSTVAHK